MIGVVQVGHSRDGRGLDRPLGHLPPPVEQPLLEDAVDVAVGVVVVVRARTSGRGQQRGKRREWPIPERSRARRLCGCPTARGIACIRLPVSIELGAETSVLAREVISPILTEMAGGFYRKMTIVQDESRTPPARSADVDELAVGVGPNNPDKYLFSQGLWLVFPAIG